MTITVGACTVALALGIYGWGGWRPVEGDIDELSRQLDRGSANGGDASDQVYADLERHLRWQPSDVRALVLKARLDMRAQRYAWAVDAFGKAVAGNSKAANDPGVWVEFAEARGMLQGKTLVGEPLALVYKALAIAPNHGPALDLAGSAAWEMRDFAAAAAYWKRLLAQIPPGTARHTELTQAIERAQLRARMSLLPTAGIQPAAAARRAIN